MISMKKVIITGANSFIGKALIQELSKDDYIIYAVVRDLTKTRLINSSKISIVQSELAEYKDLDKKIREKCDYYISLAWEGTRGEARNNHDLQKSNLTYSVDGVNAAIRLNCRTIISAGSQAEYGIHYDIISEETQCNPETEYGLRKLEFYNYLMAESKGLGFAFKEPRFFSLYGPGDYEGTLVMSTLNKMIRNLPCEFSKADHKWNYLYIDDAALAIKHLMETECENGAYNVASYDTRPLKEFIYEMYSISQSASLLSFGDNRGDYTGPSLIPSIEKITNTTRWAPGKLFVAGITDILHFIE